MVECLPLDFSSGHDLTARGIEPCVGLRADLAQPAWDFLSLPLPLSSPLPLLLSQSLFLSQNKYINNEKKPQYFKLEYYTEVLTLRQTWPQSMNMSFWAGSTIRSIFNAESEQIARCRCFQDPDRSTINSHTPFRSCW